MGYMVIPPSLQCGFAVDTENRQWTPSGSPLIWVEHSGSFILYLTAMGMPVLPFKNSETGESFYLELLAGRDTDGHSMVRSSVENGPPPVKVMGLAEINRLPNRFQVGTYSKILDRERSVFVTQRRCKDGSTSLANHIITISL
ncbi:hypothetical protein BDZ94DRAFT_1261706 [Collybia nuda]|uniref:Uncharacterized protein n=1 Tax=Collybia nuda TaxID=64659 RepID=A0A9P6CDZ1_9AGAR|nr:hypothetical protein BDZ94DRAFT_1261706 [Collybia nuda]